MATPDRDISSGSSSSSMGLTPDPLPVGPSNPRREYDAELDTFFREGTKAVLLNMDVGQLKVPMMIDFCDINDVLIPANCRPLPENKESEIPQKVIFKRLVAITYSFLKKKHGGKFRLKTKICQICWIQPAEFLVDGCPYHVGVCSGCGHGRCPFCEKKHNMNEKAVAAAQAEWMVESEKARKRDAGQLGQDIEVDEKKIRPYRKIYSKGEKVFMSIKTRMLFRKFALFEKVDGNQFDALNRHEIEQIFTFNNFHADTPLSLPKFDRPLVELTWEVLHIPQCERCHKYEVFRVLKCDHTTHCFSCIEEHNLTCFKCEAQVGDFGCSIMKLANVLY